MSSTWKGYYTCNVNGLLQTTDITLSVTKADSNLHVTGALQLQGTSLSLTGTYASYLQSLTLRKSSQSAVNIGGTMITYAELNGKLQTPYLIEGAVIYRTSNDTSDMKHTCTMKVKKQDGR